MLEIVKSGGASNENWKILCRPLYILQGMLLFAWSTIWNGGEIGGCGMKNIIKFPCMEVEDKEYSGETFEWLADRMKEYVNFLTCNALKKDKTEWSKKFIAVLKFLGDYSLEDELEEFETRR